MFDWQAVRGAYLAGEYSKCRVLLQSAPEPDATIWLARIDTRQGRDPDAIGRLSHLRCDDERIAAERDVWLAAAIRATGDFTRTHRLLDHALQVLKPHDEAYYRALYVRGLVYLVTGDLDATEPIVRAMLESPDVIDRAQSKALRAWVCAKRGNIRENLNWIHQAMHEHMRMEQPDQYGLAHTVLSLAVICREVAVPEEVIQDVRKAAARTSFVEATAFPLFQSVRVLGWVDALQGDEVSAIRQWRNAENMAPSEFWRVFCLIDRAYFAQVMGRSAAARETLAQADALASGLTWSETRDEERLILLTIAQLFSTHDPARAERYLARFRSLTTEMEPLSGWHGDRRARALQIYPHAMALLHLGEVEAAIPMLEEAWTIFTQVEYGWRAALAAFSLYEATGDQDWLQRAREQIAPWPRSWIASSVQNSH